LHSALLSVVAAGCNNATALPRRELKQRRSVAGCNSVAAPAATVPQRRKLQQRCCDTCYNIAATLPRHVLQQRRSTATTRAAAL